MARDFVKVGKEKRISLEGVEGEEAEELLS